MKLGTMWGGRMLSGTRPAWADCMLEGMQPACRRRQGWSGAGSGICTCHPQPLPRTAVP